MPATPRQGNLPTTKVHRRATQRLDQECVGIPPIQTAGPAPRCSGVEARVHGGKSEANEQLANSLTRPEAAPHEPLAWSPRRRGRTAGARRLVGHAGAPFRRGLGGRGVLARRAGVCAASAAQTPYMVATVKRRHVIELGLRIDRVMRHERCSDDESDSYPRIDYLHFIDSSRACLALWSWIILAEPV